MGRGFLTVAACAALALTAFGAGVFLDELLLENDVRSVGTELADTDRLERENLAAQQMTAFWTRNMGIAAIVGIVLSAAGIFLVYRTWQATRTAAAVSRNTYDAFITVERAKIVVSVHDAIFQSQQKALDLRVTNIGKSHCTVSLVGYLWNDSRDWIQKSVVLGKERSLFLGAGQSEVIKGALVHVTGKKERVHGFVRYNDILGERRSFFAFEVSAGLTGAANAIALSPAGMPEDI